jgi:hypothetical protein
MSGLHITFALTRRQADALLRAKLSVGHGVIRSGALVEAERRLMDAVRKAIDETTGDAR